MKLTRSLPPATTVPVLTVADVRAAVAWLTRAFGFVERLRIGEGPRSQLDIAGGGAVSLAGGRPDPREPRPREASHSVLVRVSDARAHFVRSREAGARILMEPTDFEY